MAHAYPLERRQTLNTIIEDELQSPTNFYLPRSSSINNADRTTIYLTSPLGDEMPTPRANMKYSLPSPVSSRSPSRRRSEVPVRYEDLYDAEDERTAEVSSVFSSTSRKTVSSNASRNRYPALIIPSPTVVPSPRHWPTIEKQKAMMSPVPPTPPPKIPVSPAVWSAISARNLQVPPTSATPSLDGSQTSEDLANMSCPSTPDIQSSPNDQLQWTQPVQLHPEALETLQQLNNPEDEVIAMDQVIEVDVQSQEMQQVGNDMRRHTIDIVVSPVDQDCMDPLSALSIPSPGGFFSSLAAGARHTWAMPSIEAAPTTSIAETFYGVPWRQEASEPIEQIIEVPEEDDFDDGLPTARPIVFPVEEEEEHVEEINPNNRFQYNENYEQELSELASASIDRTSLWLCEQSSYVSTLKQRYNSEETINPAPVVSTPILKSSIPDEATITSPATKKKSVRFAEGLPMPVIEEAVAKKEEQKKDEPKTEKDSTFYQGFQYLRNTTRSKDAFNHRHLRAEAMQLSRTCLTESHRDHLLGIYEIHSPLRPSPNRPISMMLPTPADPTEQQIIIARAQKERQALDQLKSSSWYLAALEMLNGGSLISDPAALALAMSETPRILDLGGQAVCDWAWQISLDYNDTTVYTVSTDMPEANLKGPSNHRQIKVSHLWKLPFPDAHFDVISARSLFMQLKAEKPLGENVDEYDLCLRECLRCLKPGGYLEYTLLDADIVRPGHYTSALSVEFCFNLKTRGYDPSAGVHFVPRLNKAGFSSVKRAWMVLPMASSPLKFNETGTTSSLKFDANVEKSIGPNGEVTTYEPPVTGSTVDASNVTGIVGSWAWEKWMLKLQIEMGKDEGRLLESTAKALEEGGRTGAGWKYLTGWARKSM